MKLSGRTLRWGADAPGAFRVSADPPEVLSANAPGPFAKARIRSRSRKHANESAPIYEVIAIPAPRHQAILQNALFVQCLRQQEAADQQQQHDDDRRQARRAAVRLLAVAGRIRGRSRLSHHTPQAALAPY
jgi:hypothetical protein